MIYESIKVKFREVCRKFKSCSSKSGFQKRGFTFHTHFFRETQGVLVLSMISNRVNKRFCALLVQPRPRLVSPSGHVLEEEDEGDADADEADRHRGDHQLLQAVEQLLLRATPLPVVEVLKAIT